MGANHKIKLGGLIATGVGTIVGSGWLFGAAHAASSAGPASLFSWLLGAVIIMVIAFSMIEISMVLPTKKSGIGYYLESTHGNFMSFLVDWVILIGFVSSVPSEAVASIQYLSNWDFAFTHGLYDSASKSLSFYGLLAASLLCVFYFAVNYFSLKLLIRFMKLLTWVKLVAPFIVVATLIYIGHHEGHSLSNYQFAPHGFSGVVTAIVSAGIIYTFNGFQTPITFAKETENPNVTVPLAVMLSILLCSVLYMGLQYAYLIAMPTDLVLSNGWGGLNMSSPFVNLVMLFNLNLLALLLYVDAFISPMGAGLVYNASSSRIILSIKDYLPEFVSKQVGPNNMPKAALVIVLLASFVALWLLPSWDKLAAIISVGYVVGYTAIPVGASSMRRQGVKGGLFKHKALASFEYLGFVLATFMLYWSCWPLTAEFMLVVAIGIPLYLYYQRKRHPEMIKVEVLRSLWFILYLLSIVVFSYFGSTDFGGNGFLSSPIDHVYLAIIATIFYIFGIYSSTKRNAHYIANEG